MSQYEENNSMRAYMREILKIDLVTPEEEIALAARIKEGDDEAREHLVKANLRLVVKIAGDYMNYGLPLVDLIAEGNLGLMKAVDKFDPEKGGKLSTYASWWIKQSMKRALANQGKTIRLPVHMVEKIARFRRIVSMLSEEMGREPTNHELSEELGIPARKLGLLKQYAKRPVSLDATVGDGEGPELIETVGDLTAKDPLVELESKNLLGELDELLERLDQRESRIIVSRFGLDGKAPLTLEELGRQFGLTRERIRQVQNAALVKMRGALSRKDNGVYQRLETLAS